MKIGDTVMDSLTEKVSVILEELTEPNGNKGYRIDSDYLKGYRFPWEIDVI